MLNQDHEITKSIEFPLEVLKSALGEAQSSVRAYDTKAQIVGVGYVFTLGVIGDLEIFLPSSTIFGTPLLDISVSWGIGISPILLFGFVLYPTRYSTTTSPTPSSLLYIDTTEGVHANEIEKQILNCNPVHEYSRELLLVSTLRDKKRRRFLRGLFAAAFSFVCICLNQLYRAYLTVQ